MGCLTAPFKLLFLLLFVAALALGWLYRDRIGDVARAAWREVRGAPPAPAVAAGTPTSAGLSGARRKIAALAGGADSVVLTPDETASLLRDGLDPYAGAFFDSMRVRLAEGSIGVSASVRTERLPAGLLGPFGGALRPREPVSAQGPLTVTAPGRGAWTIQRARFRDIPLPRDAVPRLIGRATGDTSLRALPVRLPRGVHDVRVRADGVTLYGARQ